MPFWTLLGLFVLWRYYANKSADEGDFTPERQAVYDVAMNLTQNPEKLRVLANAFENAGLVAQAKALRKRASLPNVSKDVQAQRQRAMKAALSSTDPKAVRDLADAFEAEGLGRAAGMLREYATGLAQALEVPPVRVTPPAATPPDEQLQHPEHQVPPTQAGMNMAAPFPPAAVPAPVPPAPHGEGGDFGVGTVIPSQYPHPLAPDTPPEIPDHDVPPIPR